MPLSLRQDLSHQKVNFFDDSNFPSRKHCRSPSFLRDSSFHRSRVCVPLSLRQDLSHQKVIFLDYSNFPSRKHCRSPSFLRHSSFHRSRVCVPLSLRQDLIYQKVNFYMIQTYLPGNTIALGLLRVRQTHISYNCTLPMWRCGMPLEGCCI